MIFVVWNQQHFMYLNFEVAWGNMSFTLDSVTRSGLSVYFAFLTFPLLLQFWMLKLFFFLSSIPRVAGNLSRNDFCEKNSHREVFNQSRDRLQFCYVFDSLNVWTEKITALSWMRFFLILFYFVSEAPKFENLFFFITLLKSSYFNDLDYISGLNE